MALYQILFVSFQCHYPIRKLNAHFLSNVQFEKQMLNCVMFKTITPSKKGSFVPLDMMPFKIPKLTEKPINFFKNQPSSSNVLGHSRQKLKNREDAVVAQLQEDRSRRQAEIHRLELLNDSSLKVEKVFC